MGEGRSFFAAVVAGSLAAGVALALVTPVDANKLAPKGLLSLVKESFAASLFAFPFVAFAGVFVALPIALGLRRVGVTSLPIWLLIGFLAGGAVGASFLPVFFYPTILGFVVGAAPGLAAAAVWWLLAERRRSPEMQENV